MESPTANAKLYKVFEDAYFVPLPYTLLYIYAREE